MVDRPNTPWTKATNQADITVGGEIVITPDPSPAKVVINTPNPTTVWNTET